MTFPLDRRTEFQIGGTWTVVTGDVRESEPITIERGTKSEAAKAAPSKCRLKLNNRHGKYSPRNPLSPYYGLIGRNTPIRVSVRGPESYLAVEGSATSYARTPDLAALDITGDFDLRVEATMDWSATGIQPLLGKWISATNQRSYMLALNSGSLAIYWSTTGADSFNYAWTLPALPRRAALRVTMDVNNGAGGHTARRYWAESLAGPWVEFGDPYTSTPAISIYSSTAPLEIALPAVSGAVPAQGRIHCAEVRSGIAGTVVASPDVRALAEGATGFTDSAGRVWTLGADASISDRQYRFHGEISAWPTRWDVSGSDVWVPIEAAGVLRRMGQGKKALGSTLRRRIPAFAPLAYWPCEDEDGALQAYSPIAGVNPLVVSTGFRFGQDSSLAGSAALPSVAAGSKMRGTVPAPSATPTEWSVHMVYAVDTAPVSDGEFLSWRATGTITRWQILQRSGTATVRGYTSDGTLTVEHFIGIGADVFSGWQRFYFRASASGGTVTWRIDWFNIGGSAGGFGSTYAGTTGRVTEINTTFGASVTGLKVGHVAVLPAAVTTAYTSADHGFSGDTVLDRLYRLANEESDQVALSWVDGDTSTPSEKLGPQRPNTLLTLFEEAAATDGGILYERLDRTALIYRDRTSLYNQPARLALDYSAGEVPPPLEPAPDDQAVRNDVTVTRSGGSSGRAVLESGPLSVQPPPDGVGPYDEALTLSLYTDAQPPLIAQWRMHLGTWDEERYPTITVWLHKAPHLIEDVLSMDIGDRVTIDNTPPWLPPGLIDQHMRGYTEALGRFEWKLAMNCTPAGPWAVGVLEDPLSGRADTDGCTLTGAITSTAASVGVTSSPGPRWITSAVFPAMFPFDVTVGGEVMRVTACTGTGLAQTFTVTRSINGIVKAQAAGEPLKLTYPMRVAL
ncbi:hypothetical protein ACFW9O_06025 [Streptomyces sp. NPDC059499]|uniref:hypothetical protein n=1 Tax=Streptomyces sp. NPDC059499 TaxID=3346852 RepID=UPI0036C01D99